MTTASPNPRASGPYWSRGSAPRGPSTRVRIAFDATIPARSLTGVGVYARELFAALEARPVDVHWWQRPLGPPGPSRRRVANGARLLAWYLLATRRQVGREGIDVFHSACAVGPVDPGCAHVMTVHDATLWTMDSPYGAADRLFHRVFSLLAARRAAAVIVPSRTARDAVADVYGVDRARLHVVPHGVPPAFRPIPAVERERVLAELGIGQPYVLFVGAEPPRKNLPRLVEAFARSTEARGDRHTLLVLAGPPEPRDHRVEVTAAKHGVANRVRRLGAMDVGHLRALYAGACCLAYVSLCEGFGLPIVEAMACGAPVLTSNGSSLAEVAGDAALLVDPSRVGEIANGLSMLLEDRALACRLAERGLARSRAFSWRRTAEDTENVYLSALGRPAPPGRAVTAT